MNTTPPPPPDNQVSLTRMNTSSRDGFRFATTADVYYPAAMSICCVAVSAYFLSAQIRRTSRWGGGLNESMGGGALNTCDASVFKAYRTVVCGISLLWLYVSWDSPLWKPPPSEADSGLVQCLVRSMHQLHVKVGINLTLMLMVCTNNLSQPHVWPSFTHCSGAKFRGT